MVGDDGRRESDVPCICDIDGEKCPENNPSPILCNFFLSLWCVSAEYAELADSCLSRSRFESRRSLSLSRPCEENIDRFLCVDGVVGVLTTEFDETDGVPEFAERR